MNNLVFGIVGGIALFFLIKQSRTVFIKEGGGIGIIEEIDFNIPVRLPDFNQGFTVTSPDSTNPLFDPRNFA